MNKEMENPKECNDLGSSCCKVCGEKANNFVAYGGISCGCCRQFFRRTVVKMSRYPYFQYPCTCKQACSENNVLCLMDKTTRNSCKRCRFVKCEISAGMKRQWVLQQYIPKVLNLGDPFYKLCNFKTKLNKDSKDAPKPMKKKRINKLYEDKCMQTESSSGASELTKKSAKDKNVKGDLHFSFKRIFKYQRSSNDARSVQESNERLYHLERADIDTVDEICKGYDNQYKSLKMGEQIIKQILFGIMYNVRISPECQRLCIKIETQKHIRIAKGYSDFNKLSETLQQILLKQNLFMMYTLIQASMEAYKTIEALAVTYFHPEDRATVKTLLETIIAKNPENKHHLTTIKPRKCALIREFDNEETHEKYQNVKSKICDNTSQDRNVAILLTYAVLFSSDNISDELISKSERQNVNDIQGKILSTLKRYLYATNSQLQALHYFRKSVETLVILKEIPQITL